MLLHWAPEQGLSRGVIFVAADLEPNAANSAINVCMKIFLRLLRRDCVQALRYTRLWFYTYWLPVALVLGAATLVGLVWLVPLDDSSFFVLRSPDKAVSQGVKETAQAFSYWGDFAGFNVALFVLLQAVGWLLRSRWFMRLAVASLLCATLAGLSANVLRFATGRPRPSTQVEDRLHGPSFRSAYQALPSAHTATAFGGALPVLLSVPSLGTPLTLVAGGVGWSRMQLNRHHLTDVLASVLISLAFSLPLTHWAARGRLPHTSTASLATAPPHALASSRSPH